MVGGGVDFAPRHLLKPKRGYGETNIEEWIKRKNVWYVTFILLSLEEIKCHSCNTGRHMCTRWFFLTPKICNLFAFGEDLLVRRQINIIFILWRWVRMMSHQWKQKWYGPPSSLTNGAAAERPLWVSCNFRQPLAGVGDLSSSPSLLLLRLGVLSLASIKSERAAPGSD